MKCNLQIPETHPHCLLIPRVLLPHCARPASPVKYVFEPILTYEVGLYWHVMHTYRYMNMIYGPCARNSWVKGFIHMFRLTKFLKCFVKIQLLYAWRCILHYSYLLHLQKLINVQMRNFWRRWCSFSCYSVCFEACCVVTLRKCKFFSFLLKNMFL